MISAVQALMQDSNTVIKDLYGRAAKQQDMDIQDLIDLAYQRFSDACHTPEEMAEAEEALGTLAENVMKKMIEMEDVRTIDMDSMKLVVQQSKAINKPPPEVGFTCDAESPSRITLFLTRLFALP